MRYCQQLSHSDNSSKVVQMILVLKKTDISSNWRYFRLRLFLIFEYNGNRSISPCDITLTSHERRGVWLFVQQRIQPNDKAMSKSRITGEFPHKCGDPGCERVLIPYAWVNGLIASAVKHSDGIWRRPESSGWKKESWSLSHLDDLAIGSISTGWLMTNALCHPDDIRCYPKSSR